MKRIYKHIFILIIAVLIVYSNIFRNEFVWDDNFFIVEREEIKDLRNIPSFFAQDAEGLYRPMRTVFYAVSYALWKENPFGYHVNSVLIHIITSILVYLIILRISAKPKLSFLAALLFAVHPIHIEAVTFITANFDMLGVIFYLLAFLYYLKAENNRFYFYIISVLFFLLGVFSNEFVVTLPLVLVCYDLLYKNLKKPTFFLKMKYYIPYFIIAIGFLFIRFRLRGVFARVESYQASYFGKLFTMPQVIIRYIQLLFTPINLSVDHGVSIALLPGIIFFSFILLLVIGFAFMLRKKSKLASFSIFWFFITLLPVMNIVPIQRMMAEVYLYLPSIGFCIFFAWLIRKIPKLKFRNAKGCYILIMVIVLGSYSVITVKRNTIWKDEFSLWSNAIKTSPESSKAHSNLALELDKRGLYDKAIEEYKLSIQLNPNRAKTYFNLGVAYGKTGTVDEAIIAYTTSLELKPGNAEAYNNRGILYIKKDLPDLAISDFKNALDLKPGFVQAYVNLGNVYNELEDYEDAISAYQTVISLNPNIAEAHYNLGIAYHKKGLAEEAEKAFDKAYGLNPNLR
ncbi:hypothetical protein CMO89_01610 [Candidatus Woesearchaeota archaeon]|nr:hypothetical protein [Candidatus Woesearchaeota archaeon]|tara:strand:- start:125 stop:1831 length:1707 start_codon:yes stop_codon:yes gene_type:complete